MRLCNQPAVVSCWWEWSAIEFLELGAGKMSQLPSCGHLQPDLFFPVLQAFLCNCFKLSFCLAVVDSGLNWLTFFQPEYGSKMRWRGKNSFLLETMIPLEDIQIHAVSVCGSWNPYLFCYQQSLIWLYTSHLVDHHSENSAEVCPCL